MRRGALVRLTLRPPYLRFAGRAPRCLHAAHRPLTWVLTMNEPASTPTDLIKRLIAADADARRRLEAAERHNAARLVEVQAEAEARVRASEERAQTEAKRSLEASSARAEAEARAEMGGGA